VASRQHGFMLFGSFGFSSFGGFLKMQLSFHLFILLLGFVLGNLFPTFFGDFLGKVGTPLFLFLALDFFNYFYYTNAVSKTLNFSRESKRTGANNISSPSSFSSRANSLKIGFLFGLFVDAFKVGS
jgi:hypothetical protein